jgi:hypothetical protein
MPLSLSGGDIKPLQYQGPVQATDVGSNLPGALRNALGSFNPTSKPAATPGVTVPATAKPPVPGASSPVTPTVSTRPTATTTTMPPVKPLAVNVPGVATQQFGQGHDLRSTAVLPTSGPDRFGMAEQRYGQFINDTAERDFDATRMLGQRAAAMGRSGSGMVSKDYADLGAAIERERGNARGRYLTDALEGTIGDARNNRAEVRGERDYQTGSAQQSLENRIRQQQLEEQLTQGNYGRQMGVTELLATLGYGGNGVGDLLQGAGQQQQNANQAAGGVGDLLQQYAFGQSVGPYGTGGVPTQRPGAPPASSPQPAMYGQQPGTSTYAAAPQPGYQQVDPALRAAFYGQMR